MKGRIHMKCPNCGSEKIQFGTNVSSGFDCLDVACCGIVFGPIGWLLALCGTGVSTDEFWICQDCGHKFSNRSGQHHQQNEQRSLKEYAEASEKYIASKEMLNNYSIEEPFNGTDEIRSRCENMRLRLKNKEKAYREFTKNLKKHPDKEVRSLARMAGIDDGKRALFCLIMFLAPFFIDVSIPIFLLFWFTAYFFGIRAIGKAESAKKTLYDKIPEIRELDDSVKQADGRHKLLCKVVESVEYIETYERKYGKNI